MKLADLTNKLLAAPLTYLDYECPRDLWAFMSGYGCADEGPIELLRGLDARFKGPSGARAYTKVFLLHPGSKGVELLLAEILALIAEHGEPSVSPGALAGPEFVSAVVGAIEQGRPGMMLGEPTVSWLANYWSGFLAGTERVDARVAAEQRACASAFGRWMSERYDAPDCPWHKIVRAFAGPGQVGLRKFAELWRAYEVTKRG